MVAKFSTCVALLTIVALLANASASIATANSKMVVKSTIGRLVPAFDPRTRRSLRSAIHEDDSHDERAFDIKKLITAGTHKVSAATTKLAESAKLRLTSDKQQLTNKLYGKFKVGEIEPAALFTSPQIQKWAHAVTKKFNPKNSEDAGLAMITTLKLHYDDDVLASMLVAANKVPLVKKLQEAHLLSWKASGKSSDDVFTLLKLQKSDELFENPMLATWAAYVKKLYPARFDEVMFLKMKTVVKDESKLTNMLIAVQQKDHKSRSIAKSVENGQLWSWKEDGKSTNAVFNLLQLNKEGDNLLSNPALITWMSYLSILGKNPDDALFAVLRTRYNDDEALVKVLLAAQGTKTRNIAEALEIRLLNTWVKDKKSVEYVFKVLAVDKSKSDLFDSPPFKTWVSYVSKFDKENPDELIFKQLNTVYGKKHLVKLVDQAGSSNDVGKRLQEEIWRSEKMTGDDVLKLLKLDEGGYEIFKNPAFSTWVSYVTKLNKLDKASPDAISHLVKRFDEFSVAKLLASRRFNNALNDSKDPTPKMLQDIQFTKWKFEKGWDADDVKTSLSWNTYDQTARKRVLSDFKEFDGKSNG